MPGGRGPWICGSLCQWSCESWLVWCVRTLTNSFWRRLLLMPAMFAECLMDSDLLTSMRGRASRLGRY